MVSLKDAQDQLELYLLEVEEKYLKPHIGTTEQPDDYMFDVKSYCILCHAAFEEFIENVCLVVLNEVVDNFENHQKLSYSTLCLLHFVSVREEINEDNWKDNQKLYDYFYKKLDKVKSEYSKFIMEKNHGVGLKYLKKMLIPIGIDIPQDPVQQNSLTQLANFRGGYAHTSLRVAKKLSPEDAIEYVYDVHKMMVEIANRARNVHYHSIH